MGNKVYYVSTLGTDNTDTGRGTSPELHGEQLNMLYSIKDKTLQTLKQLK